MKNKDKNQVLYTFFHFEESNFHKGKGVKYCSVLVFVNPPT